MAVNPKNPNQMSLFFCSRTADDLGENRHPQIVMRELSEKHGFKVIGKTPQSLFDGWSFWIEYDKKEPKDLPRYLRDVSWSEVGSA